MKSYSSLWPSFLIRSFVYLTLLWSSANCLGLDRPAREENPLTVESSFKNYYLKPQQSSELKIILHLPDGYRAYQDQFKIKLMEPEGFKLGQFQLTPVIEFFDKNSKKQREGVANLATMTIPIEAPADLSAGPHDMIIELSYQACTDSFCLFPQSIDLKVPFELIADSTKLDGQGTSSLLKMEFSEVFKKGLLWTFVFVFLAGVLTSFTPCIFPMIPITLSVLGKNAHARGKWQNFLVSNLYVLGIAVTYSIMGVVAASTGALFGSFMSHPLVLSMMCLIFLAMALSMFGFYELDAPAFIQNRFSASDDLTGYSGAFFSGVISGVVASPCVGPVLVGVLTFIAKSQNLWLGFFLMFTYALGMGQIFLILGIFSQLTKLLPKSGAWLDGVKHVFGVLMLGVFYYFLSLLLPLRWWDLSLGLGIVLTSGYFGVHKLEPNTLILSLRRALLQSMVLLGAAFLIIAFFDLRPLITQKWAVETPGYSLPASNWIPFSDEALARAKEQGKPVIVDFYAEWCGACKELEQYTFTNQRFQLMSTNFILMKFDATTESPLLETLRSRYEIIGLPTVLFFNGRGQLLKDLTLTSFETADDFLKRMSQALK